MAWTSEWPDTKATKPPPPPTDDENRLISQAKDDFKNGMDWEANARLNFEYDYKFANGDTHNKYQWDNDLILARELDDKPCLTINKVQQHNLMVINDAKQNKPGVRIRPVGEQASFEGAQIFQELIYHIEYISSAENVYDSATTFQVQAGWGYWRVDTDYINDKTFDQEIYIRHIKDPRSVYLDPDINEIDGSDARWGIIFEDMDKDLFKKKHPKFADVMGSSTLGNKGDGWLTESQVRIALYYYKEEKEDKLVHWVGQDGIQVISKKSELDDQQKIFYQAIKKEPQAKELLQFKERNIVTNDIHWVKIAGDRIIEGPTLWLGSTIPIVRLVGTETVIDGVLDRKGHTRALINAQQIYNFMSSSNVEFISTQTKTPWVAPSAAMEGFEEYYKPLDLDTPLPTPDGWTTMGQVEIGDWLLDENGNPVEVIGMSAVHQNRKCYRVEFDDGSFIVADETHEWTIERRFREYALNAKDWVSKTIETKDLVAGKDHIWCAKPFNLPDANLPIDPYVLGVWLGDGSSASNRVHSADFDVAALISNLMGKGYTIGKPRKNKTCFDVTIHGLRNDLIINGLLNNKHIPSKYLRASYEQRLSLIQGLMDTDGHYHKATKQCIFVNTNKNLVDGMAELLRSLGVKPFVRKHKDKEYGEHYRVGFSVDQSIPIFKLPRKAINQLEIKKLNERRAKRFKIVSITEVNSVPVRCVALNSKSHLFLAGEGMVPTHNTANRVNHSYLPYNAYDDDGNQLPVPVRNSAVSSGTGYIQQMQVAQNELMMASGQYQAQMGENENAKSGVAINARQRQGDRATYHFIDNLAIAVRRTGKILVDLIPKVYDTPRVKKILAQDGTRMNVKIDTEAPAELQNTTDPNNPAMDNGQKITEYVFNPDFGQYDIQADTGPSFATKRMETATALLELAKGDENFMKIGGDILMKNMDFAGADVLALRYGNLIPPQVKGEGLPPEVEQVMNQSAEMIQNLQGELAQTKQQLADKEKELTIKAQNLDLNFKKETAIQAREDYKAETERVRDLFNTSADGSGPAEILAPVVRQLIAGMMANGELNFKDEEEPPIEGAKKSPKDGLWYVEQPEGGFARVEMNG
jgi:hypothetical protein